MRVRRMVGAAVVGLGLLAAGCGGGGEAKPAAAGGEVAAGGEAAVGGDVAAGAEAAAGGGVSTSVPAGWPDWFPVPGGATLLAGMTMPDGSMSVMYATADPMSAFGDIMKNLTDRGWATDVVESQQSGQMFTAMSGDGFEMSLIAGSGVARGRGATPWH